MTKPQRSQRISRALVGCLVAAGERQGLDRARQTIAHFFARRNTLIAPSIDDL